MAWRALLGLSVLWLAGTALAAPPQPPDQIAHSGVLLDGGGVPLPGPVDLAARLYDAASGGTLLFKQSFAGVPLADGHFTVHLGPTGEASDSPTDPLTTSLRTALVGDLVAGPGRFVEITVDADPPLARVQLVLVPYALRADHALTADVASNALDSAALGGLDPVILAELFEHYSDGHLPVSTDPREGTADPDGDGEANFVDPDNDGDTLSDGSEISLGTDINLVTPRITNVAPGNGLGDQVTQVTVTGTGFVAGLTAVFGAVGSMPVSNVTSTSFQASVGPNPFPNPITVDLTVTNPNGQSDNELQAFTFDFAGSQPVPLPFGINAAVLAGISAQGEELLIYATQSFGGHNRYAVDTITDGSIAFDKVAIMNGNKPGVVGWNASRVLRGLRGWTVNDQIQVQRDANGDYILLNSEYATVETPGVDSPVPRSPALAFDSSGRPGGGYLRLEGAGAPVARAYHDRDGNNAFTGPNEAVVIESVGGATDALGDAGFDSSGRLAYVYYDPGNARIRLAHDRSGDGDFGDSPGGVPELGTLASIATPACLDMSFDGSGRLGVVYVLGGVAQLLHDRNSDADFADAGESQALPGTGVTSCDVATSALTGRLVIVTNAGSALHLIVDTTDDGDFTDPGEDGLLATPSGIGAPIAVTTTGSGNTRVLTPIGIVGGPVR
jgi:hypothetical protein